MKKDISKVYNKIKFLGFTKTQMMRKITCENFTNKWNTRVAGARFMG